MVKHGLAVNLSFHGGFEDEVVEKQFWGGRYCLWLRVLEWSLVTLLVHRFCYFHVFAGMVCVDWSLFFFFIFDYFGVGSILGVSGICFPLQGHICYHGRLFEYLLFLAQYSVSSTYISKKIIWHNHS